MSSSAASDDRLRVLEAVTDSALEHLELDEFLRAIVERARALFDVDTATVLLYDATTGLLRVSASVGIEDEVLQGVTVPLGAGFAGVVAATREPLLLDRVDRDTVVSPVLWSRGIKALLGVPMLARGELVGVLHVGSTGDRRFGDTDVDLLRLVADRVALTARTEVTRAERAAAVALQHSLLPARLPDVPGLALSARYVPATRTAVGGDWYDVFPLPGDRFGIVMGDVAGNGLPAAVVMGRLRSALRAYALDHESPARVMTKLNRKATHFEHGSMATVSYAVVEADRTRVTLSLAGHLPPVLAAPGRCAELVSVPVDPPIGLSLAGDHPRRDTVIDLPPGAAMVFYTDGLVERRGESIDDCLARLASAVTPEDPDPLCARIMSRLIGHQPTRDDVALLVARRR
ncbi:PP2C family protein-serine/threonine phosphatase [Actinokineospora enzanensis]|uniref:PP2C family protein-serine/threonine phosphatase n=1 Tax=Actinokineospora enzanensis TaxID=155975 RepID=UPI0003A6A774|nr:GAF domain-containing SpoIIE family protein phosphatase [Actinokineospora enzanensis]